MRHALLCTIVPGILQIGKLRQKEARRQLQGHAGARGVKLLPSVQALPSGSDKKGNQRTGAFITTAKEIGVAVNARTMSP